MRLRVPNHESPVLDETGFRSITDAMRFRKVMEVAKIPKPEEPVELETSGGRVISARVVRADWNEGRGMFVVSCQYANRSITTEEYSALANDPEWELKHLLE